MNDDLPPVGRVPFEQRGYPENRISQARGCIVERARRNPLHGEIERQRSWWRYQLWRVPRERGLRGVGNRAGWAAEGGQRRPRGHDDRPDIPGRRRLADGGVRVEPPEKRRTGLDRFAQEIVLDCQRCVGKRRRQHRSEEHTSELQSLAYLVCRLLLEKKKKKTNRSYR